MAQAAWDTLAQAQTQAAWDPLKTLDARDTQGTQAPWAGAVAHWTQWLRI